MAKPMPDSWYSWIVNRVKEEEKGTEIEERKKFNRRITADKKPYFMKYIYPAEKKKLNEYIKNNNIKCLMRFRLTLDELRIKLDKTEEEEQFLKNYDERYPLGVAPCTVNKICKKIEKEFDGISFIKPDEFDYSILKSNVGYDKKTYAKIARFYKRYNENISAYMQRSKTERIKPEDRQMQKFFYLNQFIIDCKYECPNEDMLCDIVLDLCYSEASNKSKQFAWDMCGNVFVKNLLRKNDYVISYPELDENGDIYFGGNRFSMKKIIYHIDEVVNSQEEEMVNDTCVE